MGIFGAAKKGFGMLGKRMAKKRILQGTSTRADRIKHGGRSPDIKSVPMSETAKKDIQKSVEKAKKKLKHMVDTKRAFHIGKSIHPADPKKGSKEWGRK